MNLLVACFPALLTFTSFAQDGAPLPPGTHRVYTDAQRMLGGWGDVRSKPLAAPGSAKP